MRLKQYIDGKYIGLVDKKSTMIKIEDNEIISLLNELNILLGRNIKTKNVSFNIVDKLESPSHILKDVDESKVEKITRRWMVLSERLEQIKDSHIKNIK